VDIVLNVLLYVPLGIGLTRAGAAPRSALLTAALLSTAIEVLQVEVIAGRFASTLDVVTNVLGAGLGIVLGRRLHSLLAPSERVATALAIAASVFWLGITVATAWLLQPVIPPESVIVRLTPRPGARASGGGEIIEAALGGRPISAGRVAWRTGDREIFVSGVAPLHLKFVPNSGTEETAPRLQLFAPDGERRLLLGQSENDVVFQVRRHANDLRLRSPALRLPGLVAARGDGTAEGFVGPYDTLHLIARVRGADLVLSAATRQRAESAELRLGALAGWSLFFYRGGDLRNIGLQLLWFAVILIPLGYWASHSVGAGLRHRTARNQKRTLLGIAVAVAGGLVVVPLVFGYGLPPAWEVTSVVMVIGIGWWAATFARGERRTRGRAAAGRATDLSSTR
jgi:hypothetical protein